MVTEPDTRSRRTPAPATALGARIRSADFALVCSVPLALGLVFLLPRATRRSFVFDYTAPTATTAFASAFVHLNSGHLLVNVGLNLVSVLSVRSVFDLVGYHAAGLALAASLGALWYGLTVVERCPDLCRACRRLRETPWAAEPVAVVLVVAVPFVAFPALTDRNAGVLNLYAHLLGYALGFLVPFVTTTTRRFVARRAGS